MRNKGIFEKLAIGIWKSEICYGKWGREIGR
jgi:hypothetical protein